jgi:hypothetical protein
MQGVMGPLTTAPSMLVEIFGGMSWPGLKAAIHSGGLTLSTRRLTFSDLTGSATIMVSMKLHFGHSNVRFSERSGRTSIVAKSSRVRHRAQRGRSIGKRNTSVRERGMLLT